MSEPASAPPETLTADELKARDLAMFERRLRLLEEATEIAMDRVRAFKPDAVAASEAPPPADPEKSFATASRNLRLCISLESTVHREMREVRAGIERGASEEAARIAHAAAIGRPVVSKHEAHQEQAHSRVFEVIESEAESEAEFVELLEALDERFEFDWAYRDCGDRPLRETVERLCKDLDMNPDMSRWDDGAEGWIKDGPPKRPAFSHFHKPSRIRLVDDGGGLLAPPDAQPLYNGPNLE
jgi:hypothetical protein